jgi:hypothetical protein
MMRGLFVKQLILVSVAAARGRVLHGCCKGFIRLGWSCNNSGHAIRDDNRLAGWLTNRLANRLANRLTNRLAATSRNTLGTASSTFGSFTSPVCTPISNSFSTSNSTTIFNLVTGTGIGLLA